MTEPFHLPDLDDPSPRRFRIGIAGLTDDTFTSYEVGIVVTLAAGVRLSPQAPTAVLAIEKFYRCGLVNERGLLTDLGCSAAVAFAAMDYAWPPVGEWMIDGMSASFQCVCENIVLSNWDAWQDLERSP